MPEENINLRDTAPRSRLQYLLLHPEEFDPDKLEENEIRQSDGTIFAKIPRIPGRITRRKKANGDEYYIELVISRHYDPETKQNRNKKVIIGTDISHYLRGMMAANDNYHDYFNTLGQVAPHIAVQWREEEKQKDAQDPEEEPRTEPETEPSTPKTENQPKTNQSFQAPQTTQITQSAQPTQSDQTTQTQTQPTPQEPEEEGEATEVQLKELREREDALDRLEKQLNQKKRQLDSLQARTLVKLEQEVTDHIRLLRDMLQRHLDVVEEQAKRRPDKPMSLRQIRTINEILGELRTELKGSEVEDYLHLAEEPREESDEPTGTTYGEMVLILNTYECTLSALSLNRLRMK